MFNTNFDHKLNETTLILTKQPTHLTHTIQHVLARTLATPPETTVLMRPQYVLTRRQ